MGTAKVDLCLQGSINMINWCLAASQLRRFSDASNKSVMADIFAQKTWKYAWHHLWTIPNIVTHLEKLDLLRIPILNWARCGFEWTCDSAWDLNICSSITYRFVWSKEKNKKIVFKVNYFLIRNNGWESKVELETKFAVKKKRAKINDSLLFNSIEFCALKTDTLKIFPEYVFSTIKEKILAISILTHLL